MNIILITKNVINIDEYKTGQELKIENLNYISIIKFKICINL